MSIMQAASPGVVLFGINGGTKAVFFRQLATMVHSGLPVGRAIKTSSEIGLQRLGTSLATLVEQKGCTLSEAMAKYPYHFTRYEVALVRAGEKSGQMDRQLEELAKSSEADWQMRKRVTSKLIYPLIVAHSAVVLPPLFLLVKEGLAAYLWAVLGILIPLYTVSIGFMLTYRLFKLYGGPRAFMDNFLSNVPVIAGPMRYAARIRFLRTLANLVDAGFLPSQAVPLAADSCDNYWLRDKVIAAWEKLGKEISLSSVMRESRAFGSFELGLVLSGEEAGTFASSLKKASESLQPEFDAQIHRLMTIVPIIMLFIVGSMVAFVAIKTMTGIFAPVADLF
jgi:type IV pilus assembly protein PilC